MASHINNVTIASSYSSPKIKYDVSYTATRISNSKVKYQFKIVPWLDGDTSATQFLTGLSLKCFITVNGIQGSVELKSTTESWINYSADQKRTAKYITIECGSTTANANQTVTFQVTRPDGSGNSGKVSTSDYYVTSPALLYTACTAPTTFTASSNNFESNVTLSWSGAKAGTNNSINSYLIRYRTSSNNSTWGAWADLTTISSTSASGSKTIDMSSKIARGYYVQFAIRTQGSAGSSYYSAYAFSAVIRRNPYTQCTAPTSFTISTDMSTTAQFEINVTLNWSGATNGSNNAINGYLIQYRTSSNTSFTNSGWKDLKTIATTKTSGSVTVNLSSLVTRTHYVQFAIRTQGQAGSSYYSTWKYYQTSLQRNPYTKCTAPTSVTITSEADINGTKYSNIFNKSITIAWSAGGAGENNAIKRYYIEYCTSSNNSTWGSWDILQSSDLTPVGTSSTTVDVSSKINRGAYMKIRIRTEGVVMTKGTDGNYLYYSEFVESASIRRNSVPNAPTTFTISSHPTLEYSYKEDIVLSWNNSADSDNNLKYYQLEARITTNGVWGSWTSVSSIIGKSTLSYSFTSVLALYTQVANGEQIQFRIRAYDNFGEVSSYKTSTVLTRYDITGVSIGINGKWVNCQVYVGTNGSWIEQDVFAGVNNAWVKSDRESEDIFDGWA